MLLLGLLRCCAIPSFGDDKSKEDEPSEFGKEDENDEGKTKGKQIGGHEGWLLATGQKLSANGQKQIEVLIACMSS